MRLLAALLLTALSAAASGVEPGNAWDPEPEQYRYVIYQQESGSWKQSSLTNEPEARCPYDEPWRDPVTAVRIEDRETGETQTIDCSSS